jgi:general secretion pathway protein E
MSQFVADRPNRQEREWMESLGASSPRHLWRPVGCADCSMTGYRGRIGIFEVVRLGEVDIDMIVKHADEPSLRHHFRKNGARSFIHDDLKKVAEGITSLSEIYGIGGGDLHRVRTEENSPAEYKSGRLAAARF